MDLWPLVAPGWNKPAIWPSAQCHQWLSNVAITMSCLPPMTGNGTNTNFKNCDDWEMVYCCFTHIILIQHIYIYMVWKPWTTPTLSDTSPLLLPLASSQPPSEDKVIVSFKAKGDGSFELRTPGENKLRMAAGRWNSPWNNRNIKQLESWFEQTNGQGNPPFGHFVGHLNYLNNMFQVLHRLFVSCCGIPGR